MAVEIQRHLIRADPNGNEILIRMGDEDFLRVYRAALQDFDSLSNNEKSLVHSRFLAPMGVHLTSTFLAARDGLVDREWADEWMSYWTMVVKISRYPNLVEPHQKQFSA